MTIKKVHQVLLSGKITPRELLTDCQSRLRSKTHLNAVLTEVSEEQLSSAIAASEARYAAGKSLGPLDGIPFVVKDNYCTANIYTTCGSRALEKFLPPYTATLVARLLASGALLVAKTSMDEFAMGSGNVNCTLKGSPTRNPWSPAASVARISTNSEDGWHVAGGSSGGSAVALSVGGALAALGSDTGGSTRLPAAHCGLVGLKATYGRLSRWGLVSLVNALDHPSILARTVSDAALLLSSLAGPDDRDSTCSWPPKTSSCSVKRPLRIGIPREYHAPGTHPQILAAWERAAKHLHEAGCQLVTDVHLPHTKYVAAVYSVLNFVEVASNQARYDGLHFGQRLVDMSSTVGADELVAATRKHIFNDVVRGRILAGNYFLLRKNRETFLRQAQCIWRLIREELLNSFTHVDVLLTPAQRSPAASVQEFSKFDNRQRVQHDDVYLTPANLSGIPSLVLPVTLSKSELDLPAGLPISVQLMAQPWCEQTLLQAATLLEQSVQFAQLTHIT